MRYECPVLGCGKIYTRLYNLRLHRQRDHPDVDPLVTRRGAVPRRPITRRSGLYVARPTLPASVGTTVTSPATTPSKAPLSADTATPSKPSTDNDVVANLLVTRSRLSQQLAAIDGALQEELLLTALLVSNPALLTLKTVLDQQQKKVTHPLQQPIHMLTLPRI